MKLVVKKSGIIDLAANEKGLLPESGFETAVLISLFTDRHATVDDVIPGAAGNAQVSADRRGWIGDALPPVAGDRIGSRLWLLQRENQTEETRRRAIFYCREALQWLIDDGHVRQIDIAAQWQGDGILSAQITLHLVAGGVFDMTLNIGNKAYAV